MMIGANNLFVAQLYNLVSLACIGTVLFVFVFPSIIRYTTTMYRRFTRFTTMTYRRFMRFTTTTYRKHKASLDLILVLAFAGMMGRWWHIVLAAIMLTTLVQASYDHWFPRHSPDMSHMTNTSIHSLVTPSPVEIRSSGPFGGLVNSLKDNMSTFELSKSQESRDKVAKDWGSFGSKESHVVACLMAIGQQHLNNGLAADDMSLLYREVNTATQHELQRNTDAAIRQWAGWLLFIKTGNNYMD